MVLLKKVNSADRCMMAFGLQEPDRVPVTCIPFTIGAKMAEVTVDKYAKDAKLLAKGQIVLHKKFGIDTLIPFSDISQIAEAWGTTTKYVETSTPYTVKFVVNKPEDWEKLDVISVQEWWERGRVGLTLEASLTCIDEVESTAPVLCIVPSPLTLASWIGGLSRISMDMKRAPELVHRGLDILAESCINLCKAYYDVGIATAIFACTRATADMYTVKQYLEYGMRYDLKLFGTCKDFMTYFVHVCGREPYLEMIGFNYPSVLGINYWDRGSSYDLSYGKKTIGKKVAVVGGLDQTRTLIYGTPEEVEAQALDAIRNCGQGGGFLLAPGCELPHITPVENIAAMVRAAEKYGRYPLKFQK